MGKLILKDTQGMEQSFSVTHFLSDKFHDEFHYHTEYELTLITKGHGTRFVGDHVGFFKEGDLLMLGTDLPHVWKNELVNKNKEEYSCSSISVHFNIHFLGSEFFDKPELSRIKKMLFLSGRGLSLQGDTKKRISEYMLQMDKPDHTERLILLLQILHLISQSTDNETLCSARFNFDFSTRDRQRMREVCKYVSTNFRESITLNDVAEAAHMTKTAFCRYFKQRTDKNFSIFLNEMRISYACALLHERRLKIAQIGYESGYESLSTFNKQFKDIMHCTPKEYNQLINK